MKLSLDSILYKTREFKPITFIKNQFLRKEFKGIKQYYHEDEDFSTDYIYVVNLSTLFESVGKVQKNLTYICINDSFSDFKVIEQLGLEVVVIEGKFPLPYVLNYLLEIYDELTNWDKNMHIASLEGKSPQEMVDLSESIIEHPLIIFDSSFNVMAYTKHIPVEYELFKETIESGYTHSEIIKKVQKERIFNLLNESNEPVVQKSAGSDENINIYIKISDDGILLAYSCIFFGEHVPDSGYIDIIKSFFDNLSLYFKQNNKNQRYGNLMYENFITGLISNKDISPEKVEEQLKYTEGVSMYGPFILGQFQFKKTENVPVPFLARELDGIIPDTKPFIYQNHLYLLKKIKDGKEVSFLTNSEKIRLCKILENYEYFCGISEPFDKIIDISFANLQCQKSVELGCVLNKGNSRYFYYGDYQYYHMFENIRREMPLQSLQNYKYKKLKEYEKEYHLEYTRLVSTYLKNENNATKTANDLFMHRNTIQYTIKKIEELFNISFDNFYTKQDFILAHWIDKYIEFFE